MMQLTKTDFIQYLDCPKSLWLSKRDPDNYPVSEFSAFLQKLVREGYEVEQYARCLVNSLNADSEVTFQKVFETTNGLYARADIVVIHPDSRLSLSEVKSSTSLKKERGKDHIKDACFQLISAEAAGYQVASVSIIHVNGDYVRNGEINVSEFLTCVDVTVQARAIIDETRAEIAEALLLLSQDEIDRDGCCCRLKSRSNHCDGFAHFNPNVPLESIYSLPRLSDKKRQELLDMGCVALRDVPDDFKLSPQQTAVLQSAKTGQVQINDNGICSFINGLTYPLYFFDYETFCSAVPFTDGVKPHQHIPIQYSLHRLSQDGNCIHYEFLAMEPVLPEDLILAMKSHIGPIGSVISWYDTFEKTRNRDMALMFPEHAEFLHDINSRMVNLEDVFKVDYVDIDFKGSTSIKKVLPVVCPHLNYANLSVQDGTGAMQVWMTMTAKDTSEAKKAELKSQLLEYCKLDTFAMVELYEFLLK
jgi:CRISPR/Cas system-associated exonuclease Cas4 (RecB family)